MPLPLRRGLLVAPLLAALTVASGAHAGEDDSTTDDQSSDATESDEAAPDKSESKSDSKDATDATDKDEDTAPEEKPEREAAPSAEAPPGNAFARFWLGVSGSVDIAFVRGGKDVCPLNLSGAPANSLGVYCTTPYGTDFPLRGNVMQNALVPGRAGALDSGPELGDIRVLLALDYAVTGNILVGLRGGYVGNTYPGTGASRSGLFRGVHVEARGTYVFGTDPLSTVAFAPVAFVGAGIATADVSRSTSVALAGVRGTTPVDAWQLGGAGLLVVGGGARYTFSPRSAFTLAWKLDLSFGAPTTLLATAPEATFQFGF